MSITVTIDTSTTDALAAAVEAVIADYINDHGSTRGLTRGQIIEIQLTDVDHDEVNHWAGDVPLDLMTAYHTVLNAVDDNPAALDRVVFGQPAIQVGQPVMFRANCTAAGKKWWAGGNFVGEILDATPDANDGVLVGWGGTFREFFTRVHCYRVVERMDPDDLLNP